MPYKMDLNMRVHILFTWICKFHGRTCFHHIAILPSLLLIGRQLICHPAQATKLPANAPGVVSLILGCYIPSGKGVGVTARSFPFSSIAGASGSLPSPYPSIYPLGQNPSFISCIRVPQRNGYSFYPLLLLGVSSRSCQQKL